MNSKPSAHAKKATFVLGINFPFLAGDTDSKPRQCSVNGCQGVIFECVMGKHWQKLPLPRDFKTNSSQQGATSCVCVCRGKKRALRHTPFLKQGEKKGPVCHHLLLQNMQGIKRLVWTQAQSPTPGKSSWQGLLNKVHGNTEARHEIESRHSQNLVFP